MFERGERVKFGMNWVNYNATVLSDNGAAVEIVVDLYEGKKWQEITIQKSMLFK